MTQHEKEMEILSLTVQLILVTREIAAQELQGQIMQGTEQVILERIADMHKIAANFEKQIIELRGES